MKKFGFATAIAGGFAALIVGLAAPAQAAPAGPGTAEQTINQLQSQGYNVIVNRIGSTPLSEASVVAVRPGQTHVNPGNNSVVSTLTGRTVYVDVK